MKKSKGISSVITMIILALIICVSLMITGCGNKTTTKQKVTKDDQSSVFKYNREITNSNVKTIEFLIDPTNHFSQKEEYTYDKDDYITLTDNQKAYFLNGIYSDSYKFKLLSEEEGKSIKGYHYVYFIINYNDGTKIYLGTTFIWKLDDKGETTSFDYARQYGCDLLKLVLEE